MSARIVAGLLTFCGAALQGQVCEGRPAGDAGPFQISAAFETYDGGSTKGVGIGRLGSRTYGGAQLGFSKYDDLEGETISVGAFIGTQIPVGSTERAQFCPYVGGGIGTGPNDIEGTGINASTTTVALGAALGVRAFESSSFTVIPGASFSLVRSSFKLSNGFDSVEESDTYGVFGLGLGLLLGRDASVRPYVSIPVGLEDASASFGVVATLAIRTVRQ
jgi:hypothetical protein